ncbi:unnamed protein product [Ilex paraguariensis]|uniref:FPL domain-containing protein n=2 Tax=Ilex paraguariensis TaxID=185542 RepID=A0ABC8TPR6_9AQUA
MWFPFWRSRDRFSLDELRYLTDQIMKVQIVNDVNKDFVIEALRSIAELITYGDQHDTAFFEFFMEKQVMGEFVRILKISRTSIVSLQLLQTMSIMIQNLKSEHSIYYMFSNEHINYFITYSFDFRNEELLSFYISFLRAISGKLNKNTISVLVKTRNVRRFGARPVVDLEITAVSFHHHYLCSIKLSLSSSLLIILILYLPSPDDIVDFPLYVEAIRFAFHEEGMIRTAVRALTLNVYHVGDDCVNKYIANAPQTDYFLNLLKFFREHCIGLNELVSQASGSLGFESTSSILSAVDEIEDNLYYFSDVISAGIPDIGRLITDNILKLLVFPLLLPSLSIGVVNETKISAVTSLYLLCCILRIVKIKDLATSVAAAFFCPLETFMPSAEAKQNGYMSSCGPALDSQKDDNSNLSFECDSERLQASIPNLSSSSQTQSGKDVLWHDSNGSHLDLR